MTSNVAARRSSWLSNLLANSNRQATATGSVTIYNRSVADLANDITKAKAQVARKKAELAAARDNLRQACKTFVEHCGPDGLSIPIDMQLQEYED